MKRSPLKRKTRLNPIGKTGRKNLANLALQKEAFEEVGITECELRINRFCRRDDELTFAHAKKRSAGRLPDDERTYLVALACIPCHDAIEGKPWMEKKVMQAIDVRNHIWEVMGSGPPNEFFVQVKILLERYNELQSTNAPIHGSDCDSIQLPS